MRHSLALFVCEEERGGGGVAGSVREGEFLLSYLACRVKTQPTLNMYLAFVAFYTAKAIPSRGVL